MAVVTSDFLAGVRTNFRALYEKEFIAAEGMMGWPMLVLNQPSDGELNTYTWFGTVPIMQNVTHGTVELAGLRPDEPQFGRTVCAVGRTAESAGRLTGSCRR